MKIAYVVPGPMPKEVADERQLILREWANEGTIVDLIAVTEGPASVESMYEEYIGIKKVAEIMWDLEKQGYDAAIVGCAGDPGLDALREITEKMLVLGPGQTSMLIASMLGHKYALMTVAEGRIPSKYELAFKAGSLEKLGVVKAVNIPVLEIQENRKKSLHVLKEKCLEAVEKDGVDTIVLGCMSMGFLNVAEELTQITGIPVINPSKAVLKTAEMLVSIGMTHSKKAFQTPPKLKTKKVNDLDGLFISNS